MDQIATYIVDDLEYTTSNHRLRFSPEFHENHGKPFTVKELAYLCIMWESMKKADIAMALGRTHGTVLSKAYMLKKTGQFNHFKLIGQQEGNRTYDELMDREPIAPGDYRYQGREKSK
jgi:hypothetical protein